VSETINWTLNVQVDKGPTIAARNAITVDAYDKIGVEVAAGNTVTLELQPGGAGKVQFLLINSTVFDDTVTYAVDGGTAVKLDALHVLVGDGAVGLLGAPPQTLDVTNGTAQDAKIEVLLGRIAI
jgi:hypothetical protein